MLHADTIRCRTPVDSTAYLMGRIETNFYSTLTARHTVHFGVGRTAPDRIQQARSPRPGACLPLVGSHKPAALAHQGADAEVF